MHSWAIKARGEMDRRGRKEREGERKRVENIERESVRKRRGVIEEIQG
jgi:hypothetical protein